MKKLILVALILVTVVLVFYWTSDNRIISLLGSDKTYDLISGAYKAGETGKVKFAPYLLKDCDDPRISNSLDFKGMSVYQSKMNALRKIFKTEPPVAITYRTDSTVINFYLELYGK